MTNSIRIIRSFSHKSWKTAWCTMPAFASAGRDRSRALRVARGGGVRVLINAETIGQGYQLRAGNDALVNRRRHHAVPGLVRLRLGPKDVYGRAARAQPALPPRSAALRRRARRLRAASRAVGADPAAGALARQLDLLYGRSSAGVTWAASSTFGSGVSSWSICFDFQAFDGLLLQANTPFHLAFEAWGGLT